MGCSSSVSAGDEKSVSVSWKPLLSSSEARNNYIAEGTLPRFCSASQLEFRGLLDDAIAIVYLREDSEEQHIEDFLGCWLEIYSFKFPKLNNLSSSPNQIYQRYIHIDKNVGKSQLITKEKRVLISSYFENDGKHIPIGIFDFLVLPLFEMLHDEIFISKVLYHIIQ